MLFGAITCVGCVLAACRLRSTATCTINKLKIVYQVGVDSLMYHDARSTNDQQHTVSRYHTRSPAYRKRLQVFLFEGNVIRQIQEYNNN
jgi:hypothetical protein